ncbi:hypothetical protein [Gluconacetobacter diazotrophicus]|uniref:Putative exported protein n=1 Tax=Gluconacetobacter diazotrophicus (strain ATCC 49037 / DSM 5601 / CCUG 37298 / CIP 103539 / LMG 7603 / PAl5) TaxID=272568 RepID=A9H6I5_GLUDA|nr:hypothetical protein [Gluconacetobacter diazotrophicus]CAP57501.1 putative exported protein [Gluconacetobacter diazotrophicus PA1 5]
MTDPASFLVTVWSLVAPMLPERWQQAIPLLVGACCFGAGVILQFWTPAAGSRLAWLWRLLTWLNAARGRNAPVIQPGIKSLAIPADADRGVLAARIGLDPDRANPRRLLRTHGVPGLPPPDPG